MRPPAATRPTQAGRQHRADQTNPPIDLARFPVARSTVPRHPAHISFANELLTHCVAGGEGERLVARLDEFEVVAELLAVVRIGAVLDHCMCTLARILTAQ